MIGLYQLELNNLSMNHFQFRSMNKFSRVFKKQLTRQTSRSYHITVITSEQKFEMATKLTTAKRQSYTVSEKLRIVQFAEQSGNRAAEREFGVSESNVRLWRRSYLLHLIANMGETPPTFDMPPNRAINNTGEKTTKMRTTGNEKNRVAVVLA